MKSKLVWVWGQEHFLFYLMCKDTKTDLGHFALVRLTDRAFRVGLPETVIPAAA